MKFLHTSDWHLGRTLHGLDLHAAQCGFIDQLEQLTREEQVDCVVIAGDVFDRAVPPVESVALFTDAMRRLSDLATVIVTSGNHDSAIRLGFGAPLHREGIHVVTEIGVVGQAIPVIAGGEQVLVYPFPYLDPDHARSVLAREGQPIARSHEAVLRAALDRVAADRAARHEAGEPVVPAMVVTHAFVVGAAASESERDIRVGGVDCVPSGLFDDPQLQLAYVAAGHVHGPQQIRAGVSGDVVVRYSGSPLRYSFSEAAHRKSVTLVEISPEGECALSEVTIKQPREMKVLTGTLNELLSLDLIAEYAHHWVRAIVTDPARPDQLLERIRAAYPHAISISHVPASFQPVAGPSLSAPALADPVQISAAFVQDVTGAAATQAELAALQAAYEAVLLAAAADVGV